MRLASSIIRVIGETVIQPIAIEVATVTAERGPKTDASNGRPTAAELGNPTVNAITELSAAVRCCRDRDQKKLIAYKVVYAIANTSAGAACARESRIGVLATERKMEQGIAKLVTKVFERLNVLIVHRMPNACQISEQQPRKDWYQRIGDRRGKRLRSRRIPPVLRTAERLAGGPRAGIFH